jgi:hypothetical protein
MPPQLYRLMLTEVSVIRLSPRQLPGFALRSCRVFRTTKSSYFFIRALKRLCAVISFLNSANRP